MTNRDYNKQVNSDRLCQELETAGYPRDPKPNARFYGVLTNQSEGIWTSTILCYDNLTDPEKAGFDAVVSVHIPLPLPEPTPPVDSDNKPYVRAEVRPLNKTGYFTSAGDDIQNGLVGEGDRIDWDFSNTDHDVISESGYKRKVIDLQFLDEVSLRGGHINYKDSADECKISAGIVCPTSGYYYDNNDQLKVATEDTWVQRYLNKFDMDGTGYVNIDSDTASPEIPTSYKMRFQIDTLASDSGSRGHAALFLYRKRTMTL